MKKRLTTSRSMKFFGVSKHKNVWMSEHVRSQRCRRSYKDAAFQKHAESNAGAKEKNDEIMG